MSWLLDADNGSIGIDLNAAGKRLGAASREAGIASSAVAVVAASGMRFACILQDAAGFDGG